MSLIQTRHENKPRTIDFYIEKLSKLLRYAPIGKAKADRIDEGVIEGYVVMRRALVCPATVNRELATLRRILRLAHEWRLLNRVPVIRLLSGERIREFVLSPKQEELYLTACPQPLHDIAVLMLETGLRIGEALNLEWPDVTLKPLHGSRFGFLRVREGKSKSARRVVPLTDRTLAMLKPRAANPNGPFVFGNRDGRRYVSTSINHLHRKAFAPKQDGKSRQLFPGEFVLHSLRHTMLTRLGEAGVDAFTIMRIAGHSSIVVSQRYIHPTPESVERAFETLQRVRTRTSEAAEAEAAMQRPATVFATLEGATTASC